MSDLARCEIRHRTLWRLLLTGARPWSDKRPSGRIRWLPVPIETCSLMNCLALHRPRAYRWPITLCYGRTMASGNVAQDFMSTQPCCLRPGFARQLREEPDLDLTSLRVRSLLAAWAMSITLSIRRSFRICGRTYDIYNTQEAPSRFVRVCLTEARGRGWSWRSPKSRCTDYQPLAGWPCK